MVAKCANPQCGQEFRQLSKGRLFLLPPLQDRSELEWKAPRLADHCYWLCPECSTLYVIEREGSKLVVTTREGIQ